MNRNRVSLTAGLLLAVVATVTALAADPSLILYNGTIVPMTAPDRAYSAMLVRGSVIERLGSDEEIVALAGPDTARIDLDGRAVYPGFIDPHTHLLGHAHMEDLNLAEAEVLALGYGLTHVADMHIGREDLPSLLRHAARGMSLRVSMYLLYNDGCGTVRGNWYERYPAGAELEPGLYVGGIKVFSERSVCGDLPIGVSFGLEMKSELSARGRERFTTIAPLFSAEALAAAFERIDRLGYQIAVHAIGDGGISTTLDAFELLLAGGSNEKRHMLLHNWFISDTSLARYAQLDIGASVEVSAPCYLERWGAHLLPEYQDAAFRYADLVATDAHIAASSDWPWVGPAALEPLFKLQILTTGTSDVEDIFEQGRPCAVDASKLVTVWEALRMMTVEAAYLLNVDDISGTLEPGKWADFVVLSADPLRTPPDDLHTIEVEGTYVDGELVWDRSE